MNRRTRIATYSLLFGAVSLCALPFMAIADIPGAAINPGRLNTSALTAAFNKISYNINNLTIASHSTTIPITRPVVRVNNASNVILDTNPTIPAGTNGQLLTIINVSSTPFTIQSLGIILYPSVVTLYGNGGTLSLIYSTSESAWLQIGTRDTFQGQFGQISYNMTSVTIANAASTIPITTPFAAITSAPAGTTTLGNNPIDGIGSATNGQIITVANASGQTIVMNTGNGVLFPGATLTLGQSATFMYVSAFTSWALISSTSAYLDSGTVGVLPVANGGTNGTSFSAHHVLLGQGSSTITTVNEGLDGSIMLGVSGPADPQFALMSGDATITNNGVLTISAGAVNLTTDVSGVLPTANGGLGSGALQSIWTVQAVAALANGTSFNPPSRLTTFAGKARRINCSWTTIGITGGGTDTVVMKVRDVTGTADLCSCSFGTGSCLVSANTSESCDCNSGAMTAGNTYAVQFSASTNCSVNPAAITCGIELTSP